MCRAPENLPAGGSGVNPDVSKLLFFLRSIWHDGSGACRVSQMLLVGLQMDHGDDEFEP